MDTTGRGLASMLALLILALAPLRTPAQTNFNSGSDGSYGAMNITADTTLDLPPNGVFPCTTIAVAPNVTLRFNRNPLNTPVYLLATGDVTINGVVNVSGGDSSGGTPGRGGPGGFDGGFGGFGGTGPATGPGAGKGPGGGQAVDSFVAAAYGTAGYQNPNTYGNALLSPLIGGSGGAGSAGNPGPGGGGGGGAILVASNTKITSNGAILANGGYGCCNRNGAGSGGGIRLVAPVVTGSGYFNIYPGQGTWDSGYGRVRIDCLDRFAFRSLNMPALLTRGSQMFVFPPFTNRLDIVQVGAQSIPVGATNAAQFQLPAGPATNLTVTVRATGFTNDVPIRLVVTPENGVYVTYDAVIPVSVNPAQTNITVLIPNGTVSTINAWTR